jgi:hypothetical protein
MAERLVSHMKQSLELLDFNIIELGIIGGDLDVDVR